MMKKKRGPGIVVMFLFTCLSSLATAEPMTGEGPNLSPRISQSEISNMELSEIQDHGRRVFSTPFNKHDGYGDGPFFRREGDPIALGNRPTMQGNGTFLRVNGLDGQTCLECHFITRNSTIPATLGVGGVAAGANHVLFMPRRIKTIREKNNFNGRFINPPFLFGSGGVELLAKEMTMELQQLKEQALSNPGSIIELTTKGVGFGTIVSPDGVDLDTSGVEGIDPDLVVRPFGRKGEFATVRAFDLVAMQFHFGMQPVEVVGEDVDADGDGIEDELLVGEISALHIFGTTLPRPIMGPLVTEEQENGYTTFMNIGCAVCHRPFLETNSRELTYSFPEVEDDPNENVFMMVDLAGTAHFEPVDPGNFDNGLIVPLFADLKRHDMGSELAESFYQAEVQGNREFTTARLWGVRDTAPYLHDGRATTITEAILMHGGEAQAARDGFASMPQNDKDDLIAFLYSLRTPLP